MLRFPAASKIPPPHARITYWQNLENWYGVPFGSVAPPKPSEGQTDCSFVSFSCVHPGAYVCAARGTAAAQDNTRNEHAATTYSFSMGKKFAGFGQSSQD